MSSSTTRVLTRLLAAAFTATVLLPLAACGGDETPKSPRAAESSTPPQKALLKGTCWSAEQLPQALGSAGFTEWVDKYARGDATLGAAMRDDVAFAQQIDCSQPHPLELYNVVTLDPALTRQVKDYADLLDQSTPLYRRIRDQVNDRCLASSPYGAAQRRAGGLPVQLAPSLSPTGGLHVAWDPFPADLWEKGQKRFVCTFQQDKPGTLRFSDLTTRRAPITARVCEDTPARYVPCSGPHQAEDIAGMMLNTAIEKGQINGRKAVRTGPQGRYVALSDAEYARLDKVCQTFLSMVSTMRGGVVARSYPGLASQWPTKSGAYVARCFARKPLEPPPMIRGSVFDRG